MAKKVLSNIEEEMAGNIHHGHNLKRFRKAKGDKQLTVAKAIFGEGRTLP